jgi:hypothetical protein
MQTYWGFNGGILAAVSGAVFYLLALLVFVLVYGRETTRSNARDKGLAGDCKQWLDKEFPPEEGE